MAQLKDAPGMFPQTAAPMEDEEFFGGAADIDQSTVEQDEGQYPYIQWINGKADYKPLGANNVLYTGGWFIPADQFNVEELEGWTRGTWTHGTEEDEGFFKRDIEIAIIRVRQGWLVEMGKQKQMLPFNQTQQAKSYGRLNGRAHILCLVKGLEDLGPFYLTVHGVIAGAIMNRRKGVISAFGKMVIAPANAMNKRRGLTAKWAWRGFWLPIGPKRDQKNVPIFEEAGKGENTSLVTYPCALGLVEKPSDAEIRARYVGRAVLARLEEMYKQAETWATAWDEAAPAGEAAQAGAPSGYAYAEEGAEEKPTEDEPY